MEGLFQEELAQSAFLQGSHGLAFGKFQLNWSLQMIFHSFPSLTQRLEANVPAAAPQNQAENTT